MSIILHTWVCIHRKFRAVALLGQRVYAFVMLMEIAKAGIL